MPSQKRSRASLRIFSQARAAKEISTLLQTQSIWSHEIGDLVSSRNPQGARQQTALWILESTVAPEDTLDAHIEEIVAFIESHRAVLDQLRANCEIDISCFFSSENGQGGCTMEPSLLQRLAAQNVALWLDLYPPASLSEENASVDYEEQALLDRRDAERWRHYLRTGESVSAEAAHSWLTQLATGEAPPLPKPNSSE
jgi:hypothetical protein